MISEAKPYRYEAICWEDACPGSLDTYGFTDEVLEFAQEHANEYGHALKVQVKSIVEVTPDADEPSMDDLTIAFAIHCEETGLSYEDGVKAAEDLADYLLEVAEARHRPCDAKPAQACRRGGIGACRRCPFGGEPPAFGSTEVSS